MIIGGQPSAVRTRVRVGTDQFPMELEVYTSWFFMLLNVFYGAIFAFLGFGFFGKFPAMLQYGRLIELAFYFAPLAIGFAGLYLLGRCAFDFLNKKVVRIANGQVSVTGRSPFSSRSWSEPLEAYEGVRWRRFVVQRRLGTSSRLRDARPAVYQVLDLQHQDPKRCVPLGVTRLNNVTRPKWERFAKLFNLPAIDATDGETRMRAADDVDKSIKELADEGKIEAEWDNRPAPAGLLVDYEGTEKDPDEQVLAVTLVARKFPVWLYGGLMAFGLFLLIMGLKDLSFIAILFGGGLSAGVAWHWRYEGRNPRTVRIARTHVEINTPNPGNPTLQNVIQHGAIESVYIKTNSADDMTSIGATLVVETDTGTYSTGSGLSRDGLSWLRDLILAAVAKA